MAQFAIVADDLSGAVESAAMFLLRTTRITVTLDARSHAGMRSSDVHVVDTDSRQLSSPAAAARAAAAVAACADVPTVLKKIDSLLRGNLLPELVAVHAIRPNIIVAPALPTAGRTVRNGIVHLDGRPIADTDAWRAESGPHHATLADALSPLPTVLLSVDQIRSGTLAGLLGAALDAGAIPVCDAESDADLDLIVAAAAGVDRPVLVGSAGLAAALARTMPDQHRQPTARPVRDGSVLVVVGSAASSIPSQLEALLTLRPEVVLAHPADLQDSETLAMLTNRIVAASAQVTVVSVDPAAAVDPLQSRNIAEALATAVTAAAGPAAALVLTGGETARLVLDRLGVTELQPLFSVHHGAVVCAGPDGQLIATRPGSFGGPDSLLAIVRALQTARTTTKEPV